MSARYVATLWLAQRLTAAVLAVFVVVHLATMIYAVQGGLSAAEILARTQGSVVWLAFYGAFVVAAAIHAPIGLRSIFIEHLNWRGMRLEIAVMLIGLALLVLGFRAVWGVYA